MTEFEIASAIQNYVTSHRGVTDSPLSLVQIRDEVDTLRLRLLDEMGRQNNGMINIAPYTQNFTIECKKDVKGYYAEVPSIYYKPNSDLAVIFIGSSSGNTIFKLTANNRRLYASHDLYTGKAPTAHYLNGIFRFENVAPKAIYLDALFEKPSLLRKINGYDWKKDRYPIPYGMIDTIIGKTAESYLRTRTPDVPQPNTQSDLNVQGQQQLKQV